MKKLSKSNALVVVSFISCVIFVISSLLYIGYRHNKVVNSEVLTEEPYEVISSDNYQHTVVKIDGCEYIRTEVYGGHSYTHKGNCKNHIHMYQLGKFNE